MRNIFVITLLFFISAAHAAMYKCIVNGETVFSDTPCTVNAKEIEIKVLKPTPNDISEANERNKKSDDFTDKVNRDARKGAIKTEIYDLERRVSGYQNSMNKEIAHLKAKKARANNNLAGATWENSISSEMQAVSDKYGQEIKIAISRIERLRSELSRLESKE
jgi:predicted RNase H-like nuclease (RuvC/YqgF family)